MRRIVACGGGTGVWRYLRTYARAAGAAADGRVASGAVRRCGTSGGEETPGTVRSAPGGTIRSEAVTAGARAGDPVAAPAGPRAAEPTEGAT